MNQPASSDMRLSREGATRFLHLERAWDFHRGGQVPRLDLAFETWGELNPDRSNAVLILTGLSPSAHAASSEQDPDEGWWEPMIGPGRALDTDRHFVICVNSLGSCKGSTGPASLNPETGHAYRLAFPDLTVQDIAASAQLVLQALEITQLRAAVGPSLGGMSTLSLIRQFPGIARHLLAISTAARAEPFGIAIRSLQRECIVRDPLWADGAYTNDTWPETGMRLARKLGMISYRSEPEWRKRFGRERQNHYRERLFGMNFAVESYIERAAKKFIRSFDPCAYLYLSRAIDWFDLGDDEVPVSQALGEIELDSARVIGVETDFLWPPHQQKEIAEGLQAGGIPCELQMLSSVQGHDSFLVDYDRFIPAVKSYLDGLE